MRGRPTRFTQDQVIYALLVSHGSKTAAAQRLGCDRKTILNYVNRYPRIAAALREYHAPIVDRAMLSIRRAVMRGSLRASIFVIRKWGDVDDPLSDNYGNPPPDMFADHDDDDEGEDVWDRVVANDKDRKVRDAFKIVLNARRRAERELGQGSSVY